MSKNKLLMLKLATQLGEGTIQIESNKISWPALCTMKIDGAWEKFAIHLRPIILTGRGRDDKERRIQNSTTHPIQHPPGYRPLLIGAWTNAVTGHIDALTGFKVGNRIGKTERNSLFMPLDALKNAPKMGWISHINAHQENIHIFRPELLPVFSSLEDGSESPPNISTIVISSGLTDINQNTSPIERAKRLALSSIRSQKFSKGVKEAYDYKCAMCNLGEEVVEGAHIYPVEAEFSQDEIWNGISLCRNHHRLFDTHKIAIAPGTWKIIPSPDLKKKAESNNALMKFLDGTNEKINLPKDPNNTPREEMFNKRYEFYNKSYAWLKKS